jgi:hypothetical protein
MTKKRDEQEGIKIGFTLSTPFRHESAALRFLNASLINRGLRNRDRHRSAK